MSDPDLGDYVFSNDDAIAITFDRSTDLGMETHRHPITSDRPFTLHPLHTLTGAVEAKRKRVDALFDFSTPLGENYTGSWLDDSVFVVTITDVRHLHPLTGTLTLILTTSNPNTSP